MKKDEDEVNKNELAALTYVSHRPMDARLEYMEELRKKYAPSNLAWRNRKITEAHVESVLLMLADGHTLHEACAALDISHAFFLRRVREEEDLRVRYMAAREAQATLFVDYLWAMASDEKIDSKRLNAVRQVIEFISSAYDAKKFGNARAKEVEVRQINVIVPDAAALIAGNQPAQPFDFGTITGTAAPTIEPTALPEPVALPHPRGNADNISADRKDK